MTWPGIRLLDRRSALYPALSRMAGRGTTRENGDLPERCRDFIRQMTLYRTLAATLPIDRLLTRLFEETGLPAVMRVRRGGEQKLANLRLLQEHAGVSSQNGFRGLTAFIRYLDRMEEQQLDLPPAALSGHPDTRPDPQYPSQQRAGISRRLSGRAGKYVQFGVHTG